MWMWNARCLLVRRSHLTNHRAPQLLLPACLWTRTPQAVSGEGWALQGRWDRRPQATPGGWGRRTPLGMKPRELGLLLKCHVGGRMEDVCLEGQPVWASGRGRAEGRPGRGAGLAPQGCACGPWGRRQSCAPASSPPPLGGARTLFPVSLGFSRWVSPSCPPACVCESLRLSTPSFLRRFSFYFKPCHPQGEPGNRYFFQQTGLPCSRGWGGGSRSFL